jgi:hypothetical protein
MKYDMSPKEVAELKRELGNKDIIIIDESSFIGINALCILDEILRKVSDKDTAFVS